MKILVLTGYNDAMREVGDATLPSKGAYAAARGYSFALNRHYEAGSHPSWQKIRLLEYFLPEYDAVLWLDADTLVTNPEVSVEELLGDHPALVVSRDWSTCAAADGPHHFSMGNFILRNSRESFRLLTLMGRRGHWANESLWEQSAIQEEHRLNPEIRPLVKILDRRALNSVPFPGSVGEWQPGDFLCHFTGIANSLRMSEIRRIKSRL